MFAGKIAISSAIKPQAASRWVRAKQQQHAQQYLGHAAQVNRRQCKLAGM